MLFRSLVLNPSWFVAPFQRLSTLVVLCLSIAFCQITAELFSKCLCSWPPENYSMAPKWGRGLQLRNGLGFHIFRLFHAVNFICCILPNLNVSIYCCEVKFSWTVATVLFIALHNPIMPMQSSKALLFLNNILVEVLSHLSLDMCICTHSLVVDNIGCSVCMYQTHIAILS